jgi:hypothetical protein
VYLGFLAGILGREGNRADRMLVQLTALPEEDQWIVVKALAFSGLPDWQDLMRRLQKHLPGRTGLTTAYLDGSLPPLENIALEEARPSKWDDVRGWFSFHKKERHIHLMRIRQS